MLPGSGVREASKFLNLMLGKVFCSLQLRDKNDFACGKHVPGEGERPPQRVPFSFKSAGPIRAEPQSGFCCSPQPGKPNNVSSKAGHFAECKTPRVTPLGEQVKTRLSAFPAHGRRPNDRTWWPVCVIRVRVCRLR